MADTKYIFGFRFGYSYFGVTLIGVKFCIMVDIGPGHKVYPLRVTPRGPKILNFDREYLENGKSQRHNIKCMGRNIGSTRAFQKCSPIAWDGSSKGSPIKAAFRVLL